MLEGKGIIKRFGGLVALLDVDFEVRREEIVGLIGPNGSGKTTLFNVISGLHRPDAGTVTFMGRRTNGLPPHRIPVSVQSHIQHGAQSIPAPG